MTYDLCHGGHMVAEYPLLHTPLGSGPSPEHPPCYGAMLGLTVGELEKARVMQPSSCSRGRRDVPVLFVPTFTLGTPRSSQLFSHIQFPPLCRPGLGSGLVPIWNPLRMQTKRR